MGLVSPSASVMPVVTAVSVWPTCAVPVMVGAPIRETPEEAHSLLLIWEVALARTREVLPTTRVRAPVAVVMAALDDSK